MDGQGWMSRRRVMGGQIGRRLAGGLVGGWVGGWAVVLVVNEWVGGG